MTRIVIRKDHSGAYRQLSCFGHAGFADHGKDGFSYSSGNNKEWLGVEDIKELLKSVELEK